MSSTASSIKSNFCICSKKVDSDDIDVVKCVVCAFTMHNSCYLGNSFNNDVISDHLCITCTVNKINPFESIDTILLTPIFMPKKPDIRTGTISGVFSLADEKVKKIHSGEGKLSVSLYCVQNENGFTSEKNYIWPDVFENIAFNKHKLKYKNFLPIEISNFVRANSNELVFQYKQLPKNYIVFVLLTKAVSQKELAENLEKCIQSSPEDCKKRMCDLLKEMNIEKEVLSLKCTYTTGVMTTPVRGVNCKHIACFDLMNYLTMAKTSKCFKCPICRNLTYYRELFIDTYLKCLIEDYKKSQKDFDSFYLVINRNG